jgi:hypothetical protein
VAKELIFLVSEDPEGGYVAQALGESIVTDADDMETLKENVREAVLCHFDEHELPKLICLHYVRDEVIAV